MGVERAIGIGGISIPTPCFFVRDYIDHTSDGIRSEPDRYHTLVHFDSLGKTYRYIIEVKCLTGTFLRHSVNKDFDVFATEPVEHQLHIRAYTTRFSEFYARQLRKCIAQTFGRILH